MISAVVFTPDTWAGDDIVREHELVVRSLVWLVTAVVSSVVRDVTLAVPAGLGLGDVADQSGCALAQADSETERLRTAVGRARESRLIVLKAGFHPDPGLIAEMDDLIRHGPSDALATLLATPTSLFQRLFPGRAEVVGALVTRELALSQTGFTGLARTARRRGRPFHAAARPIV